MSSGNYQIPNSNDDGSGNLIYPADPNVTRFRSFDYDEIHRALLGDVTSITNADSPYTLTRERSILLVDTTGGAVTVNLPAASDLEQMTFTIRKVAGPPTNVITVDPNGADTINNDSSMTINFTGSAANIFSDGINAWWTG